MIKRCGDLHSEFCPCLLAAAEQCEYCSRLRGLDYCDCSWNGKCPLYEKYWLTRGGGKVQQNVRADYPAKICSCQCLGDNLYLYDIELPPQLTDELRRVGAFVFLRRSGDPKEAHFPVGIMQVADGHITVAIECSGVKTRRFCMAKEQAIIVTGPYYNGILGSPWIDNIEFGRVLLIAGGSGQAPAVSIAQKLDAGDNEIVCLLSAGRLGSLFARPYLEKYINPPDIHIIRSLPEDGQLLVQELLQAGKFDLAVSAGPDGQHDMLIRLFQASGLNIPLAATNNAVMCCGEGLCGSCRCQLKSGQTVRRCKAQLSYEALQQDLTE